MRLEMLVRPYEPRDLEPLLQLWNHSVVPSLPQCHEITREELLQELGSLSAAATLSLSVGAGSSGEGATAGHEEDNSEGGSFTEHVTERTLQHRTLLVVASDDSEGEDTLLGWVDCGVDEAHTGSGRQSLGSPPVEFPRRGIIRWLWFVPGERRAGESLIEAAEAHLTQEPAGPCCEELLAFSDDQTYHFYHIGHAFLSDRANHIHALLEGRGYRRYEGELFYAWRDYAIEDALSSSSFSSSAAAAEAGGGSMIDALCPEGLMVSFEAVAGQGDRPNGILRVHRTRASADEEEHEGGQGGGEGEVEVVGICECLSAGERYGHSDAQDWYLISWLGVPPNPTPAGSGSTAYDSHPAQGQGLGKFTLIAAMSYMRHELGYRHAAISTRGMPTALAPQDANSRAQSFYSNFGGFRVEDFTYGMMRHTTSGGGGGSSSSSSL